MDSTEAQLRFGSALSNTSDPSNPGHPLHSNYIRSQRERTNQEEHPPISQVLERRRARFGTIARKKFYKLFLVRFIHFLFFSSSNDTFVLVFLVLSLLKIGHTVSASRNANFV